MSDTNLPPVDLTRFAPSQNPREPGPLLAPSDPALQHDNPFQEMAAMRRRNDDLLMVERLRVAAKSDPDLAGEAQRAGVELGMDDGTAYRNIDKVRKVLSARAAEDRLLSGFNPVLRRQMSDPKFAAIAFDDTQNLSFLEEVFTKAGQNYDVGWMTNQRGRLAEKLKWGGTKQDLQQLVQIESAMEKLPTTAWGNGVLSPIYGISKLFGQMADQLPAALAAGAAAATVAGIAGQAGPQVLLPEEVLTVPTAFAFGFLSVSAPDVYRIEAGNSYLDMRQMGLSHSSAATASTLVGMANTALELSGAAMFTAPFRKALKDTVTDSLARRLLTPQTIGKSVMRNLGALALGAGGEVLTEVMQETSNALAEEVLISNASPEERAKLDLEGRMSYGERIAGIIAETVMTVGLFSSFGPAVNMRRDARRVAQSKITGQFVQDLAKGLTDSKAAKRNGTAVERFLSQLSDGTPVENLYVKTDAFLDMLKSANISMEQLQAVAPQIAGQIGVAQQTGVIEIKTSESGKTFLSTEFGMALQPHLMLDPDGISVHEATSQSPEVYAQALERAKAILDMKEKSDRAYIDEVVKIEKGMKDQLVANGRMTPATAALQARIYRAWLVNTLQLSGKQLTPEQFHQQYGLDIVKQFTTGEGSQLSALNLESSQAFKSWFKQSKVTDKTGRPIRVFHGTAQPGFARFDRSRLGSNTGAPSAKMGFFFAGKPETANSYTGTREGDLIGPGGRTATENGHDGVIAKFVAWSDKLAEIYQNYLDAYPPFDQRTDRQQREIEAKFKLAEAEADASFDGGREARLAAQEIAQSYRGSGEPMGGILPVYLSIQNPLEVDQKGDPNRSESFASIIARAKEAGHDGVIIRNTFDGGDGNQSDDIYVVFDESQIKSVNNDGSFDSPDDILSQEASTRVPTSKKSTGTEHLDEVLTTSLDQFPKDSATYKNDVALMRTMPFLRVQDGATDEQVVEAFLEHVVGNLTWLHNQMTPEHRARSRQWYDGARKIVEQWSKRYGLTNAQIAAVIAVLSPQKDWFVNMTMAERLLDTFVALNSQKLDEKMRVRAGRQPLFGSLIPPPNRFQVKKEDGSVDKREGAKRKSVDDALAALDGKTLGEIAKSDPELAAYWMRIYDQTYNDAKLARLTPEGGVFGTAAQRVQWTSYSTLAKVISVINDGSRSNISDQLGGAHKVRNFYNNIVGPNSKRDHVTIDTHAVAAAYLLALSSKSPYVAQAWGGAGAGKNALYGIQGLYPFLEEAYRRAGLQFGLLPREMQSITWEQVRAMFTAAEKRTGVRAQAKIDAIREKMEEGDLTEEAGNEAIEELQMSDLPLQAEKIWARYKAGELTADQARDQVLAQFGGFDPLFWEEAPPSTLMAATYEGRSRELMAAMPAQPAPAERTAVTLAVEAQPDLDPALMAKWEKLSPEQKTVATVEILTEAVRRVATDLGTYAEVVEQRGAWEGNPAPSIGVLLEDSTYATQFADALGKMLAQKAVYVMSRFGAPGLTSGRAVVIRMPSGYTAERIDAFYRDVLWPIEIDGQRPAIGHSARGGFSTVAIQDPLVAERFADRVAQVATGMDGEFAVQVNELYTANRTNEDHYGRQTTAAGDSPAGRPPADAVRGDADLFERAFARAEGRQAAGPSAGPGPADAGPNQGLSAPKSLGLYSPRLMEALVNEGGNPTTVVHEMSHHFMNVLFTLAREEGASPQVLADTQALLDWFGVKDLAAWDAMSEAQQEPHWEQVSYNFEIYAHTGKAPSKELEGLFARMRRWFLGHYEVIRDELNVIYRSAFGRDLPFLTPEVRGVFDRMLASQQAMDNAEAANGFLPMFQSQDEFVRGGGTVETWAAYQAALQEAREAGVTDLTKATLRQMRWLKGARMKHLKELQQKNEAERAAVREEVEAEMRTERVYAVGESLRASPGEAKLNLEAVKEIVAGVRSDRRRMTDEGLQTVLTLDEQQKEQVARLGTGTRGLLSSVGVDPDLIAKQVGYANGEEMVRELLAAVPLDEAIENATTAKLIEKHGDAFTQESMERTVDAALHNEARARFVSIEVAFLENQMRPIAQITAAAKMTARKILADRQLRSINPKVFMAAEAAAIREVERHRREGNVLAAIHAKHRQLLNFHLAREAMDAREEIAKALREMARANQGSDTEVSKTRDLGIVQAVRWILSRFGLAPERAAERAAEYMILLRQYDPDSMRELAPRLAKAQAQAIDYRQMTLEEFRVLRDNVSALMYRARRDREVRVGQRLVGTEVAVETLLGRLNVPTAIAGETRALSKLQRLRKKLLGTKANLTIAEHLFRHLDGGTHGDFLNIMHDGVRAALSAARLESAVYVRRLVEMLRESGIGQERGEIAAPELGPNGYTFGAGNGGKGMAELIGAISHIGNHGNEERMLLGGRSPAAPWATLDAEGNLDKTQWTKFMLRLVREGRLQQRHFDLVQKVWDLMEQVKPTLQASHREVTGRLFREVEARPFEIEFPDGTRKTYRGGYVPIKPDRDMVPRVRSRTTLEQVVGEHRASMPAVPAGYLKERVDNYRANAVSIDINMIAAHLDQSIRFAHVQPRIADVLRLINDPTLSDALNRVDPEMINGVILPWLDRSAMQQLYEKGSDPMVDGFWRFVRRNNGVATMMWSVVNSLQNIAGLSNAASIIGPRYVMRGIAVYKQMGRKLTDWIVESSDFMNDRLRNQVGGLRHDLNEIMLVPTTSAKVQEWTMRHAYAAQSLVQNQVDIVTWKGAYERAIDNSPEGELAEDQHRRAVAEADSAVRLTQGSSLPEDVANYQVGSPFYRTWVQFTGWFNTVLNGIAMAPTMRDKLRVGLLTFSLPMIISQAIAKTFYGTWDDDDDDGYVDEATDLLITSQLRGASGMVPAWGPAVTNLIEQIAGVRNSGDKVSTSPAMVSVVRSVMSLAELLHSSASDQRDASGRTIRDAITAITILTGIPLAPIARPVGFWSDVASGKAAPPGPWDAFTGTVSGRTPENLKR
jgi:hypothetical protein